MLIPDNLGGWATVLSPPRSLGDRMQIEVGSELPYDPEPTSGLFFLVRSGIEAPIDRFTNWNFYVPCPLYAMGCRPTSPADNEKTGNEKADNEADVPSVRKFQSTWSLLLPPLPAQASSSSLEAAQHVWLTSRQAGDRLLLLGPYGNRFNLAANGARRNLLIIADSGRVLALLDAVHHFLDQSGRVTLLLLASDTQSPPLQTSTLQALIHAFPIQVEIQQRLFSSDDTLPLEQLAQDETFTDLIRWADLRLAVVDQTRLAALAFLMRQKSFQAIRAPKRGAGLPGEESDFAFIAANYLCGYGACLACTLPTAGGGVTRACVHGPVLPLDTLIAP